VECAFLCGKFVTHFADVFRDQLVGRIKGTLEIKPLDPALIRVGALRFDPDELVLDGGALIIVDVRVEPAPAAKAAVGKTGIARNGELSSLSMSKVRCSAIRRAFAGG
jgi:hypothetical protein